MECGGMQWEEIMWLRRRVEGKEIKPDIRQFESIFVVDIMGGFAYCDDFSDDARILGVDNIILQYPFALCIQN
jgi:hypothetical protein